MERFEYVLKSTESSIKTTVWIATAILWTAAMINQYFVRSELNQILELLESQQEVQVDE